MIIPKRKEKYRPYWETGEMLSAKAIISSLLLFAGTLNRVEENIYSGIFK